MSHTPKILTDEGKEEILADVKEVLDSENGFVVTLNAETKKANFYVGNTEGCSRCLAELIRYMGDKNAEFNPDFVRDCGRREIFGKKRKIFPERK